MATALREEKIDGKRLLTYPYLWPEDFQRWGQFNLQHQREPKPRCPGLYAHTRRRAEQAQECVLAHQQRRTWHGSPHCLSNTGSPEKCRAIPVATNRPWELLASRA